VLLTNHWNRILEIDQENLTVTVEPGVITAQIHQAVERLGFLYPPDPGSSSISTIGGNVAENAGGLRGLKYGVTRNYVMGLEVVTPDGSILTTGGKTVKDVAGYSLKDILVGSEGTLGIFTKIILRIIPKPDSARTMLAYFDTVDDAAETVSAIIAAKITPAMLEFMDNTSIRSVEAYAHLGLPVERGALLLIEVDGHASVVEEDATRLVGICRNHRAGEISVAAEGADALRLKAGRRAAFASLARMTPTLIMEDVAVPRSELARLVSRIKEIEGRHAVRIANFGHAGDGNLHPNYLTDARDAAAFGRAQKAVLEVEEAAIALGGSITGEHGIGLYKKDLLPKMVGSPAIALMRSLKSVLDPNSVLNPGKVIDLSPRCEGRLPGDAAAILKFEEMAWH
jgi:glycolate oxidase